MTAWLPNPGDAGDMLRWLAVLMLSGWLCLPLARRLVPNVPFFAQFALAKCLGWVIAGYAGWLPAALGVLPFAETGGSVAFLTLIATWFAAKRGPNLDPIPLRQIATAEVVFVGLFVLGLAQRLTHANLADLEKPTNLGFLTALLHAETMPPAEAWFSGNEINYYYLGHAASAVFAQMAAVQPDHAYQLSMAGLFAMTGIGVAACVVAILPTAGKTVARATGALAALAALYAGNLHAFLYTVLRDFMPTTREAYYFPDSTRFIGFDPETDDRGFTEFTGYAFRVGDMHAHVLATPIFLGALLLLVGAVRAAARDESPGFGFAATLGALIGVSYGTNAWDVAIIGLGALAVWTALAIQFGRSALDNMIAIAIATLVSAFAVALPFAAQFVPFGQGIAWIDHQSPLWQLLVVHGAILPAILALALLAFVGRSLAWAMTVACAIWALTLVALPEFVRVVDIYGADHARANTMFKLTFRSHTLMLIAISATIGLLAARAEKWAVPVALAVAVPVILPFTYADETFEWPRPGQTLDGLRHIGPRADLAEYLASVPWTDSMSMIEAPSDSFTDGAALSTTSGRPAVLGWRGHIRLWHDALDVSLRRQDEIHRFYTTEDPEERCRIIRRYGINYIALTEAEQDVFPGLEVDTFLTLGHLAFDGAGGRLIRLYPDEACP